MITLPGLALAIGAGVFATGIGLAQEAARGHFPPADAFGEDWVQLNSRSSTLTDDIDDSIADLAVAVYAGPQGARIDAIYFVVNEGPAAIRQSWEFSGDAFDIYRQNFEADYGSESDLEDTPLPHGCSDARRMNGTDSNGFESFPVGVTLCAADPNAIVLVFTSGKVDEKTLTTASDFVVETILGSTPGTPESQ